MKVASAPQEREFAYSPAVTAVTSASFGVGTNLSWDSYARQLYTRADDVLARQANMMLRSGKISDAEVRALSAQRDLLRAQIRHRLSPFGRLYSEILAPTGSQPTFDERLLSKGSLEAVLRSVGTSRAVVNRLATRMRMAGHASIVLQITVSVVIIVEADPHDRPRVIAGQGGAIAGGAAGGWLGAWAGCAGASLLASPSLVVPLVGEVTTGGACLVGGIVGGLGLGTLGAIGGERAGTAAYDYVTSIDWIRR